MRSAPCRLSAIMVRLCCLLLMGAGSSYSAEIVREPLVLRKGGTAEAPALFDGKGMVIDLGIDVTDHVWQKRGDLWLATKSLSTWEPVAPGLFTGLFIDNLPVGIGIDKEEQSKRDKGEHFRYLPPERLEPGQMGCTDSGLIYFRWPKERDPTNSRLFIPPKPGTSCVSIECSYITIRNVTVRHAANDGFNIHGAFKGIRLESIRALSNADEGISAHDNSEMVVVDSEVAWNASYDGGVVDANNSKTSYDKCVVHDNLIGKAAAFKFFGGEHRVTNTAIYHQKIDFRLNGEGVFTKKNVTVRDML